MPGLRRFDDMNSAATQPATVDETIALVRECSRPLGVDPVPLAESRGRVLREPVLAPEDQPPFDRSSVDGYAVRLDDAAMRFRVVDRIRAGDWKPRALQPGEAVQIATGGALPADGLQVVMKEDVRVEGREIVALQRDSEQNIRFQGEDARAGATLVDSGTRLSAGALGLLASVGVMHPTVTRSPRVLHVATGNEIVPPEQTPQRGQIRDSNSTLVRAFFGQWGIVPGQQRAGEDAAQIAGAIANSRFPIDDADLLLISGGASVGEHDFTRRLLEEWGYTIRISRTTTRPGKPLIFATRGAALAFGLPGNPLAHFVCLNLYVRAALDGFSGIAEPVAFAEGTLVEAFDAGANARETLWPSRMMVVDGGVKLMPLPWRSSGDLTALAAANSLVRIPPGCGTLAAGAKLAFLPTGW